MKKIAFLGMLISMLITTIGLAWAEDEWKANFGEFGMIYYSGNIRVPDNNDNFAFYGLQLRKPAYYRQKNIESYEGFIDDIVTKNGGETLQAKKDEPVILVRIPKSVPDTAFYRSFIPWWPRISRGGNPQWHFCQVKDGEIKVFTPKIPEGIYFMKPGKMAVGFRQLEPMGVKDFAFLFPPNVSEKYYKLIDDNTIEITPFFEGTEIALESEWATFKIFRDGELQSSGKLFPGRTYRIEATKKW